jgi:hypothetical protein
MQGRAVRNAGALFTALFLCVRFAHGVRYQTGAGWFHRIVCLPVHPNCRILIYRLVIYKLVICKSVNTGYREMGKEAAAWHL